MPSRRLSNRPCLNLTPAPGAALWALGALILLSLTGCMAPSAHLTFPATPVKSSPAGWYYDVHGTGAPDFALLPDETGRLDILAYDSGHGQLDRRYKISDYAPQDVPHLILILDSIPYQVVADRYQAGDFPWFEPPQKIIAPFPSMTETAFEAMFHGPPLPGLVDLHHDRSTNATRNLVFARVCGYQHPFEHYFDYEATYTDAGLSFLDPRPWYRAELARIKKTVDENPRRLTIAYVASSSGMLSRYGRQGLDECLAQMRQLCLQLLYERHGAIKITLLADHGHNLLASHNIPLQQALEHAGFHCVEHLHGPQDIALELNGLVTFAGIHTQQPAAVAAAALTRPEIDLAMYQDGQRIIVQNSNGQAAIECVHQQLRYVPLTADVLAYKPVLERLIAAGQVQPDGTVSDADWFNATVNHENPDGPRRIWDAFHSAAINTPDVLLTVHDGYCAGAPGLENFIHMASTHGSLNQVNSAAVLMSMTTRVRTPLRSRDVLELLEPGCLAVPHK